MAGTWTVSCPSCGTTWLDKGGCVSALSGSAVDAVKAVAMSGDQTELPASLAKVINTSDAEKLAMQAQGLEEKGGSWVCSCGYEAYEVFFD